MNGDIIASGRNIEYSEETLFGADECAPVKEIKLLSQLRRILFH